MQPFWLCRRGDASNVLFLRQTKIEMEFAHRVATKIVFSFRTLGVGLHSVNGEELSRVNRAGPNRSGQVGKRTR